MAWFSSTLNKAKHFARRAVEVLNLKTEKALKDPSSLSNEELIAKNGSTRRAVTSTVTGTMINIALAVAFPPFAAAAAVNVWQLSVSAVNRHRVRREVKKRKHDDKNFKAMYKECNKPVRDIAIGCSLKVALTAIGMGVVGFDHVADGFQQVAQHAATGTHFMIGNAADGVAYTPTMSGKSHIQNMAPTHGHLHGVHHSQNSHEGLDREEQFMKEHPGIAGVDKTVHKPLSFAGDEFARIAGGTDAGNIEADTSWDKLGGMLDAGVSRAELLFKVVIVGAVAEIAQPAALLVERCIDRWYDQQDRSRAKRFYKSLKPDVCAQMGEKEMDDLVKNGTAVQDEMRQRRRSGRSAR